MNDLGLKSGRKETNELFYMLSKAVMWLYSLVSNSFVPTFVNKYT